MAVAGWQSSGLSAEKQCWAGVLVEHLPRLPTSPALLLGPSFPMSTSLHLFLTTSAQSMLHLSSLQKVIINGRLVQLPAFKTKSHLKCLNIDSSFRL